MTITQLKKTVKLGNKDCALARFRWDFFFFRPIDDNRIKNDGASSWTGKEMKADRDLDWNQMENSVKLGNGPESSVGKKSCPRSKRKNGSLFIDLIIEVDFD